MSTENEQTTDEPLANDTIVVRCDSCDHETEVRIIALSELATLRSEISEERRANASAMASTMEEITHIITQRNTLRAELEETRKQRDDYAEESRRAAEYITKLGNLLGCADGDDTPEERIAVLKSQVENADANLEMVRMALRDELEKARQTIDALTRERDQLKKDLLESHAQRRSHSLLPDAS